MERQEWKQKETESKARNWNMLINHLADKHDMPRDDVTPIASSSRPISCQSVLKFIDEHIK